MSTSPEPLRRAVPAQRRVARWQMPDPCPPRLTVSLPASMGHLPLVLVLRSLADGHELSGTLPSALLSNTNLQQLCAPLPRSPHPGALPAIIRQPALPRTKPPHWSSMGPPPVMPRAMPPPSRPLHHPHAPPAPLLHAIAAAAGSGATVGALAAAGVGRHSHAVELG